MIKRNIMGEDYKIYIVDQFVEKLIAKIGKKNFYVDSNDAGYCGICDCTDKKIYVVRASKKEMFKTLLHEYFHAVFHEIGADQILGDSEEMLCESLSNATYKNFFERKIKL